ncbi:MAG: ABC transporter permease [Dermatophilaceae bacterium]|nr:ABC transporter permease [Dermatophilaceae bacterium]NUO91542.1 ABC transporter permease [Dermatophilaceae bacterium]NUQ32269.1 ABC transporter permease [Dermatophilaceae bacterium]NUR16062.1 ABC transporter permease [Dermatophilaceae bacterium]NUR82310.1 ABC transporter permease [Dermatophilaceae bacterium]
MPEPSATALSEASDEKPSTTLQHQEKRTGRSPGQVAWDRLKKDKVAIICASIIVFFILVAILAPLLTALQSADPTTGLKADATRTNTDIVDINGLPMQGTSAAHWMGVEPRLGRDLFARWAYGARPSLVIGFVAAAASTMIGVTLGLLAGYLGGVVDRVISWVIDFFLSLPILILIIAIVPIVQKGFAGTGDLTNEETSDIRFWTLIVVLFIFGWMGLARLVRGEVKSLREREFVQAARAIGVPTRQILFREILPNLVGPIIVSASIAVPAYIVYEATLSYLGVGLVEPTASWGRTISDAQSLFSIYPLWLWPPVIGLSLLVLALSLLGDSIRDAFDPSSRR